MGRITSELVRNADSWIPWSCTNSKVSGRSQGAYKLSAFLGVLLETQPHLKGIGASWQGAVGVGVFDS